MGPAEAKEVRGHVVPQKDTALGQKESVGWGNVYLVGIDSRFLEPIFDRIHKVGPLSAMFVSSYRPGPNIHHIDTLPSMLEDFGLNFSLVGNGIMARY